MARGAGQLVDDLLHIPVQRSESDVVDSRVEVEGLGEEDFEAGVAGEGEGEKVVDEAADEDEEEEGGDLVEEAVEEGGEGKEEEGGQKGDEEVDRQWGGAVGGCL